MFYFIFWNVIIRVITQLFNYKQWNVFEATLQAKYSTNNQHEGWNKSLSNLIGSVVK